jgi:hypothetical protein
VFDMSEEAMSLETFTENFLPVWEFYTSYDGKHVHLEQNTINMFYAVYTYNGGYNGNLENFMTQVLGFKSPGMLELNQCGNYVHGILFNEIAQSSNCRLSFNENGLLMWHYDNDATQDSPSIDGKITPLLHHPEDTFLTDSDNDEPCCGCCDRGCNVQ